MKFINKIEIFSLLLLLAGGFAVRLYRIDYPLADWHSWRQADTAAVTRNFIKLGLDPFHPRYDDFSDVSGHGLLNPDGYRFVEFPVYNLLHYSLYMAGKNFAGLVFWGRMTTILAGLASALMLYFIVRRHTSAPTGLLAAFFYLFLPFNIYFTRVILPDPLMVAFFLTSLNFFDLWTAGRRNSDFILTAFFGSLAVLVKPVAVFFLLPITWWFWVRLKMRMFTDSGFLLLHSAFGLPFGLWRLYEHRYPQGIPASVWLLNGDHIRFKPAFWRWLFGERLGKLILGVWGVVVFSYGILQAEYFAPWAAGALLYLSVFATGNVRHDYYQIPIIPAVSVLLALGAAAMFRRRLSSAVMAIFAIAMMLGMSWYDVRGNFNVNNWEIVEAGKRVDQITPPDAVVVAPYGGDTAFLYQTNRRGFSYVPFPIKDVIDRFNATYYVSVNYDEQTRQIMDKYTVIEQNPRYVIVKLVEPKKPPPDS